MMLALPSASGSARAQTDAGAAATAPIVSATAAPTGTEMLAVEWRKIEATGPGTMLAAIARPVGQGPFPTVVILHGSHGFAREYVQLAQELAREGLLAVAACWFSGGGGYGASVVSDPIPCPQAQPMPMAASGEARRAVHALVQATRGLPGASPNHLSLFGHSRGGGAALHYVLEETNVQAVALDSAGYADPEDLAARVKSPVLILHGTVDPPESPFNSVERARRFEAALLHAGKPVQAKYYEGGEHNSFFTNPTQHGDEVQQLLRFLKAP